MAHAGAGSHGRSLCREVRRQCRAGCQRPDIQGSRQGRVVDQSRFGDRVRQLHGERKMKTCWVVALALVAAACGKPAPTNATDSVVVYCSADKEFAELIFKAYEAKTGVKVLPLYDTEETKTAGLTARLVAEKGRPKADVFWSSDTSRAVALVDQGLTAAYTPASAAAIPARYKGKDGRWTGFGARIRVLLYNTDKV